MFMILVEFSNLTFGLEADIERVPNVKFIPRVVCFQHLHPICIGPEGKCWKQENH